MGRTRGAAEPLVRFNRLGFSKAVVIRGATKYLPAGELLEEAPRDAYHIEVREAHDMPLAVFYAAYLLTENMASGPEAAEVAIAQSEQAPVRLTVAAINGESPTLLRSADIVKLCARLGIDDFSDVMVSEHGTRLMATLQVIGMGAAAVRACNEQPQLTM